MQWHLYLFVKPDKSKVYESQHPIGLRKHNEKRFTSLYLFKINEPKQQLY